MGGELRRLVRRPCAPLVRVHDAEEAWDRGHGLSVT